MEHRARLLHISFPLLWILKDVSTTIAPWPYCSSNIKSCIVYTKVVHMSSNNALTSISYLHLTFNIHDVNDAFLEN